MNTKKGIVETCLIQISDPFTLVVLAAYRSQELASGISPCVATEGSKDALVSLKEISSGNLDMHSLKERVAKSLQKFAFLSEEGISESLPVSKPAHYSEKASFGAHALFQKSDAINLNTASSVSKKSAKQEDLDMEEESEEAEEDFLSINSEFDMEESDVLDDSHVDGEIDSESEALDTL